MNAWTEVPGACVVVEDHATATNANKGFVAAVASGGTLGTTAINFSQFFGTGLYQASSALLTAIAALSIVADSFIYGTGTGTVGVATVTSFARSLMAASNTAAFVTAAGLGNAATKNAGTTTGTVAAGDDSRITGAAQKSANLGDLASASAARGNLGLGGSATLNVGTTAGTVAAGDDARFSGGATAATQAEMEAASSTTKMVTPQNLKWSPYAAKAFCKWGVTSTILQSAGISSITDNGTGDWTLNFSTAFSSADYAVCMTNEPVPGATSVLSQVGASGQTSGSLRAKVISCSTGAAFDTTYNHAILFGDQ